MPHFTHTSGKTLFAAEGTHRLELLTDDPDWSQTDGTTDDSDRAARRSDPSVPEERPGGGGSGSKSKRDGGAGKSDSGGASGRSDSGSPASPGDGVD